MSKEIKEKCKECVYYNEKQQYPNVKGATTHLNCLSIKCQYRKETKDLKIKRLTNRISVLESKLAESEKRIELADCIIKQYADKDKNLYLQLAEKEKENTKLKEVVNCVDKLKQFNADMKDYALVNRDVADEIYCEHQDKISFAVEQLEKVKETFTWGKDNGYLTPENAVNIINNQIKQLKEKKW